MHERYDVIVVGGGLAGASCVEALREHGFDGSVAIVAAEGHPPYSRPPLTKGFVRGESEPSDAYVEPADWYREHDVELLLDREVSAIEPATRQVRLDGDDEQSIHYGTLVLATGAEPRHPSWPGTGDRADRVHVIRTLEDSARVRELLEPGTRWIMVGGGYIGVETAASALQCGCDVDVLLQEPVLWTQFYGDRVGGWFQERLEAHGAGVHPGEEVVRLDVVDDLGVRVTTARGLVLEADHVLAGIGVEPRIDVAEAAGLACDAGVLCDRFLRASEPHVYAIGDIAEYESVVHGGRRMRIEHWDVARSQGRYVGARIAGAIGELQPYDEVPYFFSQLGDWAFMRYVGPGMGDDVVIRGSMDDGSFSAVYVGDDGELLALLAVDHDDDLDAARKLLAKHPRLDRDRLADDSVPLRELVVDGR